LNFLLPNISFKKDYKYNSEHSAMFSQRLCNFIKQDKIPQKMILCHGKKSPKIYVKYPKKTIFVDFRREIEPDLYVDINHKKINTISCLKSKFKCISSIYAPLPIFFNTDASYLHFYDIFSDIRKKRSNIFRDRKKKLTAKKVTNSNLKFRTNFLQSLLHFLKIGGYFEFTDDFVFINEGNNKNRKKTQISSEDAKSIFTHLLGEYNKFFDIEISRRSMCIKKEKFLKFKNVQKFIRIKKIKEAPKRFLDNETRDNLYLY
jgi:hypothetical protein